MKAVSRIRRAAVAVLAAAVVAAACSDEATTGGPDEEADGAGFSLAFTEEAIEADPADSNDETQEAEPDPWADRAYRLLKARQAAASRQQATETTPTTQSPADETTTAGGAPSAGAGSPISESTATTVGGGGGADTAIYTGVVGKLGRDEVVVPARAAPPTVASGHLPLTGLPGEVPNRPAVVVKVDNGGPARPQTGLNSADIVVEEEVEGGVTRFAAVFHSTSTAVGPVRSARTTDIGIINGFGSPLLLYSGANAVTDTLIRSQPTVQNRSAATSSGYWRSSARRAPSNLYSDTASHWASATGGPPPAQFEYRAAGDEVGGVDDTALAVAYRASHAGWTWDGTQWLRTQGGSAHLTASGQQISAANVVVAETREVATGMVDSSGATVPEFVFVGEGRGHRLHRRETHRRCLEPADAGLGGHAHQTDDGTVIKLTPGRTWVELIRAGAGMLR